MISGWQNKTNQLDDRVFEKLRHRFESLFTSCTVVRSWYPHFSNDIRVSPTTLKVMRVGYLHYSPKAKDARRQRIGRIRAIKQALDSVEWWLQSAMRYLRRKYPL